jgi:serine protease Do
MKKRLIYFTVPLAIGLIIGLLVAVRLDILPSLQSDTPKKAEKTGITQSSPGLKYSVEEAVINVAETSGKAVVSISTERTERFGGVRRFYFGTPGDSPSENDPFERFFEDFFGGYPEREYQQKGLGSGVIIDTEGYILTNEHVISGADKITVKLPDGREFKAKIKGKDTRSDLAVIKIDADNLPVAKLGDSDNLKIGQWAVAIGNPFGFVLPNPEPTVTVGVISALHRSLGQIMQGGRDYNDLIQTDAAINPGNSGGPLVNLNGEIVGINVAIFSTTGGYQGVGFAIPVNVARRILSRLIEGKKVLYGWLGVKVQDLDQELAEYFAVKDRKGVLVVEVLDDSPSMKAGIKEGDIIKVFAKTEIDNVSKLLKEVGKAEVGKSVKITLIRDKQPISLMIKVGERPQDKIFQEKAEEEASQEQWRGIEVREITQDISNRLRLKRKTGIVVIRVERGSPADEAGIMVGDIILEINQKPVGKLADFNKITAKVKGNCLVRTERGYLVIKE